MANVMLRLEKEGVTTVFRSRACYLVHLTTGLCSKGSCLRSILQLMDSCYQMPSSKLVLNGDCVVQTSEVAKL